MQVNIIGNIQNFEIKMNAIRTLLHIIDHKCKFILMEWGAREIDVKNQGRLQEGINYF